jgi:hypothetical protein
MHFAAALFLPIVGYSYYNRAVWVIPIEQDSESAPVPLLQQIQGAVKDYN